ncbi:MAG: cell surface protein SprA, partial [Bacteroidetes bacterium]
MFRKTHLFFAILGIFLVLSISFANPPKTNWKLENFEFEDSTKKKKTLLAPLLRQDRFGDPFGVYSGGFRNIYSPFLLKNPKSIKQNISLDPKSQNYNISEKIGSLDFRPASSIPLRDYLNIRSQDMMRYYWGKKRKSPEEDPDSRRIPKIKVPGLLGDLLGGGEIDIKPVGNIVLDFGIKGQNVENPQIPVAQQSNYGLNFDQQIAVNLVGNIGKFIPVNVNWDTKANFQFQNIFKVGYQAKEEDIIQEVKFGNVSMPVNNSLISGAQNLLGIQTRLRFGKLWINAVGSSQRGTAEQMVIRGGGQGRAFEFRADQYEYNRHFFLSQFFRDNFERGLRTIPQITSGVVITRVEIYTTNRNNNTQTLRNVLGTMDLAENVPYRTTNASIGQVKGNVSANETNDLFKNLASNPIVRDVNNVSGEMDNKFGLQKGVDYELLRGARKLTPQEYTFHPNLGYVTLSSQLRNDEILAVSYEYTYNGKVYKVGEMTEDYQGYKDSDVILLKMLKPSTIRTDLPTWNLMMKNIYNLQTTQLERTNFQLRIIYRDDLTGIDNPNLQEGFNTKDKPLVQIFGMDRLNMSNDPQPDGNFDFVDGVTVDAKNGRIVFPNLEPFGKFLQNQFIPESERQLINKYVFSELYRETQADAQLLSSKSKFFIKGSYQATTSNQITLPGVNIAPNSVVVRAGSTVLKEGSDYTVDYSLGRVNLMNQGILSSSKEIVIQYERADLFNFQTRNLFGLDAEYRLSKDIRFTATVMSMNERPNITRLSVGSETATNTVWGLGVNYRSDSRMLTRLIDKLPAVSTKAPSSVVFKGDFAQIIPSTNALISKDGGTAFIDDFEAAEIGYDMTRQPIGNWVLGSTPQQFLPKTKLNPLEYSHKRAKLSWYNVDNTAFYFSVLGRTNPTNITSKDKDNHYVRQIPFGEIFKGKSQQLINNPEISLDLAYFPEERGQYNYNPNLTNEGLLPNPRENFAAITKGVTHDVDFDNINIQYIEFWLLDPFIKGENGQIVSQVNGQEKRINNSTGGDLYFNLGSISEDVIPDGRHTFENGFPANENDKDTVGTAWGVASKKQYLTNAFAAENGARARQDVGLDGMNNDQERQHFQKYLDQVRNRVNPNVFQEIQKDPSNDDFQYYLGSELDQQNAKVLDRYKRFNGLEANSPE